MSTRAADGFKTQSKIGPAAEPEGRGGTVYQTALLRGPDLAQWIESQGGRGGHWRKRNVTRHVSSTPKKVYQKNL